MCCWCVRVYAVRVQVHVRGSGCMFVYCVWAEAYGRAVAEWAWQE